MSDTTIDIEKFQFEKTDRQILELYVSGSPTKEIAWELEIRPATVNVHIAEICRKAGVSRSQLVVYILQNPQCHVRGGICEPGLHPPGCLCPAPYCEGRRRSAA